MQRMLEATARAEETHFWFKGLRRVARHVVEHAAEGRRLQCIVDCGAGTGRNLEWLREFGDAVGVEREPAGLLVGRARRRRMVAASVDALPFADESADLATSFDVLYCLDEATERQALREMWRVLRPGGLVVVNVAALEILRGSHSALTREVRRYTPRRVRERLTSAGFTVERLTFTNLSPFPVALVVRSIQRVLGRAMVESESDLTVPPWPVNAAFDFALSMEAAWLRIGNLPIGTSILALGRKPALTRPGEALRPR